jgi:hypothetical protein
MLYRLLSTLFLRLQEAFQERHLFVQGKMA